jgi:hypothetical protein
MIGIPKFLLMLHHKKVYDQHRVEMKMNFSIFVKMRKSHENFMTIFAKTKNPLNLTAIRPAWYMWCNFLP